MKGIKFFYITCPKKKEAHKIAAFLVKKKLVACANIIHNVDSVFTWKGKVTKAKEILDWEAKTSLNDLVKIMSDSDLEKVLAEPGILSASVVQGYPYADVLEMGMAFVVISDANETLAQDRVDWLAQRSWERREEMRSEAHTPEIGTYDAMEAILINAPLMLFFIQNFAIHLEGTTRPAIKFK